MVTLVTGGAGFIGSHLVDALINRSEEVRVFDNFSSGSIENIKHCMGNRSFELVEGDLLDLDKISRSLEDCDVVYHLAANPEIRLDRAGPEDHLKQNILATHNLLEATRRSGDISLLVFTSSSTVYGEPSSIPTPEDYGPLKPISIYGASKLAAEALISAYSSTYGFRSIIYRLANIIGPRSDHGVIHDFVKKLERDGSCLEVLGDGNQSKSYLHVKDCVEGMILGAEKKVEDVEIYNIGSDERIDVKTIAAHVLNELSLTNVKIKYTGGVDGGRGWKGDVKLMQLDISKLRSIGWHPKIRTADAIKDTVKYTRHQNKS